jgi:dihydrolipoamide dehydrogenase
LHRPQVRQGAAAKGFAPNVDGYGLEAARVTQTDRKAIGIEDYMRTKCRTSTRSATSPGCCGCTRDRGTGVVAAEPSPVQRIWRWATTDDAACDVLPGQVASFGLTKEKARDEGYHVKVAKFQLTANAKAHGLGDPSGLVKLIADGKYGELLGGHLIGHDMSELLPDLTLAQRWDLTVTELAARCTPTRPWRSYCRNASMTCIETPARRI